MSGFFCLSRLRLSCPLYAAQAAGRLAAVSYHTVQANLSPLLSSHFIYMPHLPGVPSSLPRCSYQGMGTALIECKSGCTCEPTKLDGTWNRRASLFWSTRVFVSCNLPTLNQHAFVLLLFAGHGAAPTLDMRRQVISPALNALLQVSRHPKCLIRVTVQADPGEFPQQGHKVRTSCWPPAASPACLPGHLSQCSLPMAVFALGAIAGRAGVQPHMQFLCHTCLCLPRRSAPRTLPSDCVQVALVAVMVAHLQEGMAQAGTLVHVQQTGEEFERRRRRRRRLRSMI